MKKWIGINVLAMLFLLSCDDGEKKCEDVCEGNVAVKCGPNGAVKTDCGSGVCEAGACKACQSGAMSCSQGGNAVLKCENGRWSSETSCGLNEKCENGRCVSQGACTAADNRCFSTVTGQRCDKDGVLRPVQCKWSEWCDGGECVLRNPNCEEGCKGDNRVTCDESGRKIETRCEVTCDNGACAECKSDETKCDADQRNVLKCDGGKLVIAESCVQGHACVNGACVKNPECRTGETGCFDKKNGFTCDDATLRRFECPAGQLCRGGACRPLQAHECENTESVCLDANTLSYCEDYLRKTMLCVKGQSNCEDGQCLWTCSVESAVKCGDDGEVMKCDGRVWRVELTSCAEGKVCHNGMCRQGCDPQRYRSSCGADGKITYCKDFNVVTETCDAATMTSGQSCVNLGDGNNSYAACAGAKGCAQGAMRCDGNTLRFCANGREEAIACETIYGSSCVEENGKAGCKLTCTAQEEGQHKCFPGLDGVSVIYECKNLQWVTDTTTQVTHMCKTGAITKLLSCEAGKTEVKEEACGAGQECRADESYVGCFTKCGFDTNFEESCKEGNIRSYCDRGRAKEENCANLDCIVLNKKAQCYGVKDVGCTAEGQYARAGDVLGKCKKVRVGDEDKFIVIPERYNVGCEEKDGKALEYTVGDDGKGGFEIKTRVCASDEKCLSVKGSGFNAPSRTQCYRTCEGHAAYDTACFGGGMYFCRKDGKTSAMYWALESSSGDVCIAGQSYGCNGVADGAAAKSLCDDADGTGTEVCLKQDKSIVCAKKCSASEEGSHRCVEETLEVCVEKRLPPSDGGGYIYVWEKEAREEGAFCSGEQLFACKGVKEGKPVNKCSETQACATRTRRIDGKSVTVAACADKCSEIGAFRCMNGKIELCQDDDRYSAAKAWYDTLSKTRCTDNSDKILTCEGVAEGSEPVSVNCPAGDFCLKNEVACLGTCAEEKPSQKCSADGKSIDFCFKKDGVWRTRRNYCQPGHKCHDGDEIPKCMESCENDGEVVGCTVVHEETGPFGSRPVGKVVVCEKGFTEVVGSHCADGRLTTCELQNQSVQRRTIACSAEDNALCSADKQHCLLPDCGNVTEKGVCVDKYHAARCLNGSGMNGLIYIDCRNFNTATSTYECSNLPSVPATCVEICSDEHRTPSTGICVGDQLQICLNGQIGVVDCAAQKKKCVHLNAGIAGCADP